MRKFYIRDAFWRQLYSDACWFTTAKWKFDFRIAYSIAKAVWGKTNTKSTTYTCHLQNNNSKLCSSSMGLLLSQTYWKEAYGSQFYKNQFSYGSQFLSPNFLIFHWYGIFIARLHRYMESSTWAEKLNRMSGVVHISTCCYNNNNMNYYSAIMRQLTQLS